ncbi:MAG: hypothetical protein R3345_08430 [Fulvivirga sp.]|nr:hypothetical protein [Fulvivirga sp.]
MEQLFYYLKVSSANAEITCFVNGFPVYEIKDEGQIINQVPINMALIGEGNQLEIVVKPLGGQAFVKGDIAPYGGGEIVSSDDTREGIIAFDFSSDQEVTKTFHFDNERFDFAETLVEPPVIAQEERLREYGEKIIALILDKNTDDLMKEMAPKIETAAMAYSVELDLMKQNLRQFFEDGLYSLDLKVVNSENIIPEPYCDGRVWELTIEGGKKPLIYAEEEDGATFMKVYVAEIDGILKVVR